MPILNDFRVGAPVFLVAWQHMAMVPHRRCVVGPRCHVAVTVIAPSRCRHGTGFTCLGSWCWHAPTYSTDRTITICNLRTATCITQTVIATALRLARRCIATLMAVRIMKRWCSDTRTGEFSWAIPSLFSYHYLQQEHTVSTCAMSSAHGELSVDGKFFMPRQPAHSSKTRAV